MHLLHNFVALAFIIFIQVFLKACQSTRVGRIDLLFEVARHICHERMRTRLCFHNSAKQCDASPLQKMVERKNFVRRSIQYVDNCKDEAITNSFLKERAQKPGCPVLS